MTTRVKFKSGWAKKLMTVPKMDEILQGEIDRTLGALPDSGEGYGSAVEPGGDRRRGAIWTQHPKTRYRNAKNGELLTALLAGGG